MKRHYTYFLHGKLRATKRNMAKKMGSYIGYTVDPLRRIRQHNGLIKGGAKSTTRRGNSWKIQVVVAGFESSSMGLKFEKMSQNYRPKAKRSWTRSINIGRPMVSPILRLNSFLYVLLHPIFIDQDLVVYIKKSALKDKFRNEATLRSMYGGGHQFKMCDGDCVSEFLKVKK